VRKKVCSFLHGGKGVAVFLNVNPEKMVRLKPPARLAESALNGKKEGGRGTGQPIGTFFGRGYFKLLAKGGKENFEGGR